MQEKILDNAYRLLEEIGRGGFGAVYRGVRLGSEGSGQVAIKLLNKNPKLMSGEYIRFQREATVMSQLVHPGIVTVFELSEDNGSYFIVMEFISGMNLREYVNSRNGKLSIVEIIDIILQAAEALEYVHSHAIVHRDIKPQNMLIEERSEKGERRSHVKLVDFGVARFGEGGARAAANGENVVGTYAYMAPEATGLTQWEIDARADIYSLGIVAYELVAGKVPFYEFRNEELLRAHVERQPPSIRSIRGQEIPNTIESIIQKCIAKNPAERYQSMFGLVCDLRRVQADLRARGVVEEFAIARKDIGIGTLLERIFVARNLVFSEVLDHLRRAQNPSDVEWGIIRAGIGIGKTRCLQEIKKALEVKGERILYLRFSESEQRLPLQALSLAINDFIAVFQRTRKAAFKKYIAELVTQLGPMVHDIGRFIPVLRQYDVSPSGEVRSVEESSVEFDSTAQESEDIFSISHSIDRRYVAPNQKLNEALILLLSGLLGGGERLVFLMDDLHLADASMLSFLTYLLDRPSGGVNFSILYTIREKQVRPNLILDNFVRRLSTAALATKAWTLLPFERNDVHEFLRVLGMSRPTDEFVTFLLEKSGGSALQLNALVKQMLAQDALVPTVSNHPHNASVWDIGVDWNRLNQIVVDFVSIEVLLASFDSLDQHDIELLRIAAVSYDVCDFEYFLVDQGFSADEAERRLIALVNRGFLEIVGDENLPTRRRSFAFPHEKIRNAILSKLDAESRRQIHYLLAMRIATLYRTPKKEQVLALAKHCDGAGDKVSKNEAVKAHLRAAKVYISSMEHNQARYHIDKAMDITNKITSQRERVHRLRECYEAEYTIQASQGNLVEASEVCRNLIEITYDSDKREALQVFWSQLLLGLGRHRFSYRQAREVAKARGVFSKSRVQAVISFLNDVLMGKSLYPNFLSLISFIFRPDIPKKREVLSQSLAVMALSQLHGGQSQLNATMAVCARLGLLQQKPDRDSATLKVVLSVILLARGNVSAAYRICEESEYFFQSSGLRTQQRWLVALRSIWIDYSMGRMDKLYLIVSTDSGMLLPSSGVMHFESYGMRAWLTLLSPSSRVALSAVSTDEKKRRRSDRKKEQSKDYQTSGGHLGNNNNSRRILDSGENSQYTALALFSDSIRFALSEKIDPLRRATEQLRRQTSVSPIGDAFADFAFSFQSLVLGHQHEALKSYQRGIMHLVKMKVELVSLVVCDALRFAAAVLPLLALSFRARGWPWGSVLYNALSSVQTVLRKAEGIHNPRRSAITPFFEGFLHLLTGRRQDAFISLECAIMDSRTQRFELLESLSLSLLGAFSGRKSKTRAKENLGGALEIAHRYELRLLERYVLGVAGLAEVELQIPEQKSEEKSHSVFISREKQNTIGLSEILMKMQSLHSATSIEDLLVETIHILKSTLKVEGGRAYLRSSSSGRFAAFASDGAEYQNEYDDRWLLKLLPNSADDPVRVLSMEEFDDHESARVVEVSRSETTTRVSVPATVSEEATREVLATTSQETVTIAANLDDTKTQAAGALNHSVQSISADDATCVTRARAPSSVGQFLILLSLVSGKTLLGWIAIPRVAASAYASREVEQDLVLLGLHVGHLVVRMEPSRLQIDEGGPESLHFGREHEIVDGDLPRGTFLEVYGRVASGAENGWRVFVLRPGLVLLSHWKISAKSSAHARKLGDFIGRHLQFFSYSFRQSSDAVNIDKLILRLSSDLITIFENISTEGRLTDAKMAIIIWDQNERRAVEGDFGGESFGFGGNSEVDHEYLQEIGGILVADRLVYHERSRKISGAGGWLFSGSDRIHSAYATFSSAEFVERFVLSHSQREDRLVDALNENKSALGSFFAFFVEEPR